MKRFVVIGHPIKHSLSPVVHEQFAKQLGISIDYSRLESPIDGFSTVISELIDTKILGANVTVPFKEEALSICTHPSKIAEKAGAVNTLSFINQKIKGDNTDGIGLITDIVKNYGISLKDKKVLLIGAGGASRGVLEPLLSQNPKELTIVNRTLEKALHLVDCFADQPTTIQAKSFENINEEANSYHVIINATSASLNGQELDLHENIFTETILAYDMMYQKKLSSFLQEAKDKKVQVADGLGMLVEQAAESFSIWLGVRPKTKEVIHYLRDNYL